MKWNVIEIILYSYWIIIVGSKGKIFYVIINNIGNNRYVIDIVLIIYLIVIRIFFEMFMFLKLIYKRNV